MKKLSIFLISLALISGASTAAFAAAASSSVLDVHAVGGIGVFNNGGGTNLDLGAGADYFVMPQISLGVDFNYSPVSTGFAGASASAMLFTGNVKYNFADDLKGLYIGVRAGLALDTFSVTGGPSQSNSQFAFGGVAGYDYTVMPNFSIGPELDYVYITAPSGGSAGGDFEALANLKYWF